LEAQIALFEAEMLGSQNTVAVNFAGNPALAIPVPLDDKTIPATSLQLVGPRSSEAGLLNTGRLIEASVQRLINQSLLAKSARSH
jgi:amidase